MSKTTFSGPVQSDNGFIGSVTGDVTATALSADTIIIFEAATLSGTSNVFVLPSSDPGVAGAIWNSTGNVTISAG